MKLTLIHPSVGKVPGQKYIRAWQMEPLPMAQIAALTPKNIDIDFWDDRMEDIPYDKPTDLVAISIETYTAKRAYQIASKYRERDIKVIMGGFHATLCPKEVLEYADCIVTGGAEEIWETVLNDFQAGKLQRKYTGSFTEQIKPVIPDRSIYKGKDYLKLALIETGRGCKFACEFCSIQQFFHRKHSYRSIDVVLEEITILKKEYNLFFVVDDNITANPQHARKLFEALIPLKIKWVGQADINIAQDEELMSLMVKSGCQGILIGFESLNSVNLRKMNKGFNNIPGGHVEAVKAIHKKGLRIYATFLYGYENDSIELFKETLKFCRRNKIFMVGFNHLTPFPGTPLYERLSNEEKLLFGKWWLSDNYTYGKIPIKTKLDNEEIVKECQTARRKFFSIPSILYRMSNLTNIKGFSMFLYYIVINLMLRKDAKKRMSLSLGDQAFKGKLLQVKKRTEALHEQ